jgi:hypothetical protein
MNKHAVFDCDDVLVNLRDHVVEGVSRILGRDIQLEDLTEVHIPACFDEVDEQTAAELEDFFVNGIDLLSLKMDHLALNTLRLLKKCGYRITVVTARGTIPNGEALTRKYFEMHNVPVDDLHVVPYHVSKGDVLAKLGEIDFYVEDNHNHAEVAMTLPNIKKVYLMIRPWNLAFRRYMVAEQIQGVKKVRPISWIQECLEGIRYRDIDTKVRYWMKRHGIKPWDRTIWSCTAYCKRTNRHFRFNRWVDTFEICDGDFDRWANSCGAETTIPTTEAEFDAAVEFLYQESAKNAELKRAEHKAWRREHQLDDPVTGSA